MRKWRVYAALACIVATIIAPALHVWFGVVFMAAAYTLIWLNRCPECKRRMIVAHPESEKVCRNCAIVQALTGKNRGDWNST
jgi:hypothetical protein